MATRRPRKPKKRINQEARDHMRNVRASASDIPKIEQPDAESMARREFALQSTENFIETYTLFFNGADIEGRNENLILCQNQKDQMRDIDEAITAGEDKAIAAFRGGAKTSICRNVVLRCALAGIARYSIFIGAKNEDVGDNQESIRAAICENELLSKDFPEISIPCIALQGSSRRAGSQTVDGKRTAIKWGKNLTGFPKVEAPWSKATGAIIQTASIIGTIRGKNKVGQRPDLTILDDVETDESANSASQVISRRRKISNSIGGLESQNKSMPKIYVGTIPAIDCITDELTDRERSPAWNGSRYRYIIKMPDNLELWEEYQRIRGTMVDGVKKARQHYRENREAMDKGHVPAWPEGYDPKKYDSCIEKLFAIEIDKKEDGKVYVACELQNDPSLLYTKSEKNQITNKILQTKLNNYARGEIPSETRALVGFIDVHQLDSHLYYAFEWNDGQYKCGISNYGKFPARQTIGEAYPNMTMEAAVYSALGDLAKEIGNTQFLREDGLKISNYKIGVDSGDGAVTEVIYNFCRSEQSGRFFATRGRPSKTDNFNEGAPANKERGNYWMVSQRMIELKRQKVYHFDANYWKSATRDLILADPTAGRTMSFFGNFKTYHEEFFNHIAKGEKPKIMIDKASKKEWEIWQQVPNQQNHFFDCVVGCNMIASTVGCKNTILEPRRTTRKRKVKTKITGIKWK